MKTNTLILAIATALLVSCKEKEAASATPPAAASPSAELSKVLATEPKGEAAAIHTARTSAKPGDEITISGRIMGSDSPFVSGRAAFILGDPDILTPCNEMPGDTCETPWDTCCDSPEKKKQGIATVQIVGADGRVLKENLEGTGGLAKLASVTVTGKVAEGSTADALVVNATAIKAEK